MTYQPLDSIKSGKKLSMINEHRLFVSVLLVHFVKTENEGLLLGRDGFSLL
jgi:hypothetical protein